MERADKIQPSLYFHLLLLPCSKWINQSPFLHLPTLRVFRYYSSHSVSRIHRNASEHVNVGEARLSLHRFRETLVLGAHTGLPGAPGGPAGHELRALQAENMIIDL